MFHYRRPLNVFFITALLSAAAVIPATAENIPDLDVVIIQSAGESISLFCLPDGTGRAFSEAQTQSGAVTDATLSMVLLNNGTVVVGFPAEDIWLESWNGTMAICPGGTIADGNTDAIGQTKWQTPLLAGGATDRAAGQGVDIVVNGTQFSPLELAFYSFNSADLNGDRAVTLSDIPIFSGDFYGAYNYRSDFSWDGVINLGDVVVLAQSLGAGCP